MLTPNTIFNEVVTYLSTHPPISIKDLHTFLEPSISIKLPNFYKIISNLLDGHILQKTSGKVKLNQKWLLEIRNLHNVLEKSYCNENEKTLGELLEGEIKTLSASSLYELDCMRVSILSNWSMKYGEKYVMYDYNAHAYHVLSNPLIEIADYDNLQGRKNSLYYIIGNNTFLDRYGASLLTMRKIHVTVIDNSPFLGEGYFFTVIGEHILECILPDVLITYFKIFFQNVERVEDYNPTDFLNIFKMKQRCKLMIRRDPVQAENLRIVCKKLIGNVESRS